MNIKIKKGLDLKLEGAANDDGIAGKALPRLAAIIPDDFPGLAPKLEVKEGDKILAGQPLLRDKAHENLKVASPASGTVSAVVRGERRKIERVVIELDSDQKGATASADALKIDAAEKAVALLCSSGMLAMMRQRPYDIVPRPDRQPRDIFVTAIDSAPLAAPMSAALAGKKALLDAGAKLLAKATPGKVYVTVGDDWRLGDVAGAEMVHAHGPHPVGNVGVQIANISPINKGETVWTLDAVTLARIGQIASGAEYDGSAIVALTGSEVEKPCLLQTIMGAEISSIISGRLKKADHHVRVISGNVLTGAAVGEDGFLRFPYRQVTVIPNGDDVDEFMGWASVSPSKMSTSQTFPGHFLRRAFNPDARLLGGRRAMIMSGQYDKYIPMDIMGEYLIKAILARDIESMERLGIYEVAPEDFALAEYADTSKMPLQQIVRDGLDYLRKETE